jgi:hypothetical protein
MNDRSILTALLGCGALSDEEDSAFRGMLTYLEHDKRGAARTLSTRQRQWAEAVYARLHLDKDEPCKNLYSQGVGHPTKPLPVYPWELNKPLRPPGRA